MTMSRFHKLTLTDELLAFVNDNCGDGTLYATPSEFVRDLLRQRKLQMEPAHVRDAILEGIRTRSNFDYLHSMAICARC